MVLIVLMIYTPVNNKRSVMPRGFLVEAVLSSGYITLVNVYVDLVVFTRIANTS